MFSSVTSWLGVGEKPSSPTSSDDDKENQTSENTSVSSPTESVSSVSDTKTEDSTSASETEDLTAKQTLEELSANAINTAKEFGSFLFSFGKAAGKTVADTANKLKTTVEEKTMIGDFVKEQDKFVSEKKDMTKQQDASVPPWIGYNEEEVMKEQILALSADKRNFLRNPPSGVQFQFDFNTIQPVAMATLQEDPNLQKMRFELVPKLVKEEVFWRNYFYRVSLIKQSTQLTSLAQSSDSSSPKTVPVEAAEKVEELPPESPPADNEFVSDAFNADELSEEDIRKEMEQLGVGEDKKEADSKEVGFAQYLHLTQVPSDMTAEKGEDIPQWEKELQQELQEYEMVNEGADLEDDDLEKEILKQIEQEANSLT
ncbi:synapse-associated protein 1-like isoform X2 [Haliotis rubra]|uniref:synapse-associated protein 1-like isoform X2 n=1 Tax=Haliotis rubra TaxID=36100 RepID=UPI001EE5E755|nr:synapse-associated protein 1-like isoform X2 [Haliotis rubra]